MDIFQTIRTNARTNQKAILSHLKNYYLTRENGSTKAQPAKPVCLFCSSPKNITKEHVLPQWSFEKYPDKKFKTMINGLSHSYTQTTIPACEICNTSLLSKIEKRILKIFSTHVLPNKFFDNSELTDIIRWLQILDYKFQVFSLVTRFRAFKGHGDIPFLTDYSLSVLDPNIEYSPTKVMRNLRRSINRIIIKSKDKNFNSLVVFKTSNQNISFFHKNNDFLFLELPQYKIAVLYFYELIFPDVFSARDKAIELIKNHYDQ